MSALNFDIVTGANVYLQDNSLFGRALEVSGLSLKSTMKEIAPIGMYGKKKVATGIDSMELSIKWDFINENSFSSMDDLNLSIRGNVQRNENGSVSNFPVIIECKGRIEENNFFGTLKHQEWTGQETKLTLDYVKVTHNGSDLLEIDVENNVFKENGSDRLEDMRTNSGL